MESQTFIIASIVLCSFGGWYVVLTKYFTLKQMTKDKHEEIPAHIPGMGPPPVKDHGYMLTEDLLALGDDHEQMPSEDPISKGSINTSPALTKRQVCNKACIVHLLGFGIISGVPFLNVLLPALFWLWVKEEHPFLAKQGREVINFQISFCLIQFLCLGLGILLIRYAPATASKLFAFTKIAKIVFSSGMYIPYNIFTVIPFFWACIVMIRGAVAAYSGFTYKYPVAQQFLLADVNKQKAKLRPKPKLPEKKSSELNTVNFS